MSFGVPCLICANTYIKVDVELCHQHPIRDTPDGPITDFFAPMESFPIGKKAIIMCDCPGSEPIVSKDPGVVKMAEEILANSHKSGSFAPDVLNEWYAKALETSIYKRSRPSESIDI